MVLLQLETFCAMPIQFLRKMTKGYQEWSRDTRFTCGPLTDSLIQVSALQVQFNGSSSYFVTDPPNRFSEFVHANTD